MVLVHFVFIALALVDCCCTRFLAHESLILLSAWTCKQPVSAYIELEVYSIICPTV